MAGKETIIKLASDRLPPQSVESEVSVLGCLMLDQDAIIKVADILKPDDFYKEAHHIIFETMFELYEKREPIDLLSVANILKEKKKLDDAGGENYLSSLISSVPTAAHVAHYAKIIQKKATLRRLISAANDIAALGFEESEDTEQVLDQAEKKLFSVSQKFSRQKFIPIKSILEDTFERIDELHREKGKLRGIPTGFIDLDNILAGLQKADLVILAARPSLGKTTLALDIARNVAKKKIGVAVFSLEMSKEQLVDRILCAEANVNLWKMRTGKLNDEGEDNDFERIGHAMGTLSETPIFIDDAGSNNVMAIRTMARRLQAEHNIGLIVVDYLQLMEGRAETDNRVQEVSEISRSLKGLARELDVPVLAISQLSRAVESRPGQRPRLADLRESGSIEQDADVVMFIFRDAQNRENAEKRTKADIIIAKHRNGPIGEVELYFDENSVTFKNPANREYEGPAQEEQSFNDL